MALSSLPALAAAASAASTAPAHSDGRLIFSALLGMAVIIVLITWVKLHPFIALLAGSLVAGVTAGLAPTDAVTSFSNGFGSTSASVGTLIALGAMFGKLLADSGGADRIVDTLVSRASVQALPWIMGLVGAIIGLPMFFEVGLVLLVPVIMLVARRSGLPLMRVAVPAVAGLSAMHGFVPPHPGPLAAISVVHANLGVTLGLGVIVALIGVIISGPVFSRFVARWVPAEIPALFETGGAGSAAGAGGGTVASADQAGRGAVNTPRTAALNVAAHGDELLQADRAAHPAAVKRPGFWPTLCTILLPAALMLLAAIPDIIDPNDKAAWKTVVDFVGTPLIALGIAVLVAMVVLGRGAGFSLKRTSNVVAGSLQPIAGIFLIVGAGGGFKQVLVDTKISAVISNWAAHSGFSVLLLAWLVAVFIRVATGSATVATITTAGILEPVTHHLSTPGVSLLVLAIGAGSLFFSHVNDAGFWLFKEYFGLSIGQTIKSWSLLETLLSVVGILVVLAMSLVIH
ncbi:GntP family permease [Gryllotalpicola reticulitermitis]|uniref:GntP family permease n=1 Tax=Gryllotalpicola reticulitermitis TaxID=1184153 RepID=A0ABV8Q4E9_9MICO